MKMKIQLAVLVVVSLFVGEYDCYETFVRIHLGDYINTDVDGSILSKSREANNLARVDNL